jgi:hypothetical protein
MDPAELVDAYRRTPLIEMRHLRAAVDATFVGEFTEDGGLNERDLLAFVTEQGNMLLSEQARHEDEGGEELAREYAADPALRDISLLTFGLLQGLAVGVMAERARVWDAKGDDDG